MKGVPTPTIQEEVIWRPKDMLGLLDNEPINDYNPRISPPEPCAPFRKFGLYVYIKSTSTPYLVHVEVEFLDRWTGKWYTYKQWPFAALFWEDTDTANGIWECFYGEVVGREIRAKVTGVEESGNGGVVDATHYFTVSVAVDFWN